LGAVAINYRVLSVLLIVAVPSLLLVGLVVYGIGQSHLRDTFGRQLTQIAERAASTVDVFVLRRIIDASEFALVPTLRQAAASGSAARFDEAALQAVDEEWQRLKAPPPTVTAVLQNDASEFLRAVTRNDSMYSEILVTDRMGRLVAASNVPSDYYQGDEDWWRSVFASERVQMSDVRWDESAATYVIEIGAPVYGTTSNELVGVVKVSTNSREMLAAVSGIETVGGGVAILVRPDGSVVYGGPTVKPESRFFAAALLRESLGFVTSPDGSTVAPPPADAQFRTYFSAEDPEGQQTLVAVVPTQLGITFPQLSWLVAASRGEEEMFAPLQTQMQYFLLLLALVAVVMLSFALWLSVRLAAPPIDPDMDLHLVEHPAVHRIDEEEST
jgi:hypothetical protein